MIHQSLFNFLYTPRTQHSAACPTSASSLYTFGTRFLLLTSRITPNCPQYSIHIHATVIRKRTLKVTRLNVCLCAFVCVRVRLCARVRYAMLCFLAGGRATVPAGMRPDVIGTAVWMDFATSAKKAFCFHREQQNTQTHTHTH